MTIDDVSLLAFVDDELSADGRVQVEKAIRESDEIAACVAMLRASQLPYMNAFERQVLPPLPESLSQSVGEMIRRHRADVSSVQCAESAADSANHGESEEEPLGDNVHRLKPRVRWLRWPALAVAFVAGAFCCGLVLRLAPQVAGGSGGFVTAASDSGMTPWIKAAVTYQALYSRDTIALLQPDMNATATTVSNIRHIDNLAVQIPDLRSQGLTFKRVQRLSFHNKPLVQIVYLPEQGTPVALCVLKEAKADAAPSKARIDGMEVVAWRRGELGYILIGAPGVAPLDALGKQLYNSQVSTTISDTISDTDTGGHTRRI